MESYLNFTKVQKLLAKTQQYRLQKMIVHKTELLFQCNLWFCNYGAILSYIAILIYADSYSLSSALPNFIF